MRLTHNDVMSHITLGRRAILLQHKAHAQCFSTAVVSPLLYNFHLDIIWPLSRSNDIVVALQIEAAGASPIEMQLL